MVAIVGGNGVGLNQASLAPLGERGNLGQSGSNKTGEKTYVNVATGNVVIQDNDALLAGRGDDVSLLRTYNSQGKMSDDNGDAWWINGYRRITNLTGTLNTAGSEVERVGQDGSVSKFVYDATRQLYVAAQGSGQFDTLSSDGTTWTWTDIASHQTETYQGGNGYTWKLATASDTSGNVTSYTYNGELLSKITNANGESVEFIYTGNNLSQERIVAADGKVTSNTRYSYDTQNRLSQVLLDLSPEDASITDGKVYATSYTYVGAGNLIDSITQTDGSYQKFTYVTVDGESRVASITDAYNNVTRFDYDTVNRQTKVTDTFGNVTVYTLTTDKRFDSITAPAANGQTQTLRYGYDNYGNITSLTDALGNVTSYTYDTAGHLLSKTDVAGNRTDNTYDANGDLILSTLIPAASANQSTGPQSTRFVYGLPGQLRFQISATGTVSELRYDSAGQKIAEIHFTNASYPVAGLGTSGTLTLGQLQSWSTSQVQSNTTRSDYSYNTRGQLSTTTTYAKINADGTGVADGSQSITRYTYDVTGNLLMTVDALNNQTSYTYDGLNRLTGTTDALQKTSYTEYDDANHKIVQHNASGRIDTQVYDNQGHLLSSTLGGELTTSYGYDALGRLVYAKDPSGVEQLHIYDAAGNLQADVNGQGEVTQYIYNVAGQRVQTIARANALTDTQFQQLKGQVVQTGNASTPANISVIPVTASASDMIARTLYDKLGRVAKTISPLGEVTELQYNAAGNLVASIQRANTLNPSSVGVNATAEEIQVTADPIKDRSSYRYYDQDQKLIGTVDAEGGIVEYRYDTAGRQTTTIAYATQNKNAQVNSQLSGLITQNPAADALSYNFYDAENQLIGTVNAEGYATDFVYDAGGHVVQKTSYSVKLTSVNAAQTWGNIRPQNDAGRQTLQQSFDKLGRLSASKFNVGNSSTPNATKNMQYAYDVNIGLLSYAVQDDNRGFRRAANTAYDQYGRVIGTLAGNGSEVLRSASGSAAIAQVWKDYGVAYTYDGANRRTSSIDQNGHRTLYYYDQAGHLTFTVNAMGEVTEQRYNHLGQLTDTIQYASRLTSLNTLNGGLQTAEFNQKIQVIVNPVDDIRTSNTYDLDGRLLTVTDPNNQLTRYTYDQFGQQIKITDVRHIDTELHYDKRGLVTDTIRDAANLHQTVHTDYDAFGRAWRTVDAIGNVTQQQFDKLGQVVEVKNVASGNATQTTYDAFSRVLTQVDAKGATTQSSYAWGPGGISVNMRSAEGISTASGFLRTGEKSTQNEADGSYVSYTFDKDGNEITKSSSYRRSLYDNVVGMAANKTYDKADRLILSTDENGNRTTYTYDDANRLLSKTLDVANGQPLVTSYKYDALGRQIEMTDPENRITKLVYDHKGQLLQSVVDPDGLNLVTEFNYDETGKTLKITQKSSTNVIASIQSYTYDALGRRITESQDGGTTISRQYQYDANNNVISVTDVQRHVTHYAYDSQNRQILSIDTAGNVTSTTYDANGRITQVRCYATAIDVANMHSAADSVTLLASIPPTSANDQVSYRYYDKDGRMTVEVSALGEVITHAYDGAGHVVRNTQLATKITLPPPVDFSLSLVTTSALDLIESYSYDAAGRVDFKISTDGSGIGYNYDKVGNLTVVTNFLDKINPNDIPVGAKGDVIIRFLSYRRSIERRVYDEANRPIYILAQDIANPNRNSLTQNIYEGTRLKQTIQYENPIYLGSTNSFYGDATAIKNDINEYLSVDVTKDITTSYTYDNLGGVQSTTVSVGNTGSTTFDKNGRILSRTDAQGQTESYTYNNLGGKASVTIKLGSFTSKSTYDDSGILLARMETNTDAQGKTDIKTYDKDGRLVSTKDIDGFTRNYTYDTNGLLLTEADSSGNIKTYSEGRIQSVADAQGTVERYSYNSSGQQSKAVYDSSGHLLSATDIQGKTESYTYNALGQKTTYTNKQGDTTTYSYDTNGVLKTVTTTAANGTSTSFDSSAYSSSKQNLALVNVGSSKTGELTAVDLATGNVLVRDSDATMAGLGRDVSLLRTYNGQGKLSDGNGDAWWINGYRHVSGLIGSVNTAGSTVYRAGQDGSAVQYVFDAARQLYVAAQGSGQFDTLVSDGTTWTWTDTVSHQTETYQGGNGYTWKLATASDTSGNVTSYTYNGELLSKITNANGESVEFIYTGNNLSQERIVAADGKVTSNTRYSYDTQNRLSQVLLDLSPEDASITDGKVYATSYTYVGAGNLIDSITQTDGSYQKFTYVTVDGESRVASITDAYNNVTRFDYDTVNRQTKVTDTFGNVTVYTLTTDKRFDSITAPAANGQTQTLRYGYDNYGNITSLTDALGNVTSYTYDTAGHLLSKTDVAGNRTDNTYDANGDLILSTLIPAASANQSTGPQSTRFVYGLPGQLRFQISATGTVSELRYDSAGQKIAEIHFTNASYPVAGLGTSGTLTLGQLQSWSTSQVQSNTTRSDYSYNTRGQLSTTTTYAKINADGTGVADGSQSITRYTYDVTGNLLMTVDALNNQTSYTYDGLNRLTGTTDALQKTSYTEYDDANHKIVQHNASGRIDTQVYDNQGHLLSSTLGGELTTSYGYDALGRLVYAKDPSGVEQLHIYDAAGNLQADVNGQGEVTQYIYNVAGQRVQTIARANALTDTQFQQLKGQVVQTGNASTPANISVIPVTASASDMIARTLYDKLGRVAKTISPLGEVTELQYNAAGNLVASIQRANTLNPSSVGVNATAEEIQVTADPIKDRSSYRYYDQDQKLIGTVDAEGGIVEYRYDTAGRQTTTIAYATQNKNAQVNSQLSGLITQNPAADALSYNFYDAENQLIGTVNAEGYATEYSYDLNGRLTQTLRFSNTANIINSGATWDAVKPMTDGLVTQRSYDALGREKTNVGTNGSINVSYYDDKTGWLVQQVTSQGTIHSRFQNQKYDQFGRVIGALSNIGAVDMAGPEISDSTWATYGVTYTYDVGNRRTSSTDQNGHRTLYYYDQAGHLTHTINALGEVTENRYNHLGQLTDTIRYGTRLVGVASLTGGLVTSSLTQSLASITDSKLDSAQHLTYDLDGRLTTSTDAGGTVTTYTYDQLGERTSATIAISDTENVINKTTYNKLGQVTETIQDANGIKQTIHTDYDAFGRTIRSVDANGNATTQKFDRLGRTVEVLDQTSTHSNKTSYNAFDQVLTLTDAKGNATTYTYNNRRATPLTMESSAEGIVTSSQVNAYGQLTTTIDSNGIITIRLYNKNGDLVSKSIDPTGSSPTIEQFEYDKTGLLKESTDANGNKTTYVYDDANRLISKTLTIAGSAPLVTTYAYDAKGQQVEITDPNNVKTKLEYDLKGQLIKQTVDPDGLKLVTEFSYDKRGKTLKVTQKGETQDLVQRYVFDKLGRRIEEYTGTTLTRSYQYDANNNVISTTDALNNVTRFAYDSEDRQILVLDAAGGMQRTVYDENGRIKSARRYATAVNLTGLSAQPTRAAMEALIPAETAQDRFSTNTYDKDGRVISTVDALGGVVSYVYDVSNNVVKKTSGDGINPANDRTQLFAYDGMNRLTVSIAADGSVTSNAYDGNGNVTSTTSYANRISTANLAVGATTQTYLNQVQVNAQQDRTTRFVYDAANRLAYSVDAQGYVTKNTYEGTHLKSTTQYDQPIVVANSNLASIQAAVNSSAKDRTSSYEYDHAGHLLKTTDAMGFTEKYTYNSLGQKGSFTNKKGATWTYTYDAVGRLETEKAPAVEVATIDLKNGAKSSSSAMLALETRFVYDAVGNLKARIEASNSDQQRRTEYTYDALGRQIGVTYPPVDVTDSSTGVTVIGKQLTTRVTYDTLGNAVSNIDVAGKRSYKVYDQLGRVRFDIDANGYLTEYKRNTFGEVESLIRYANDKRDTSSETAPTLAQIVPLASAKDRQIKTQYNQLGQAAVVTESVFYGSDGTHYEYQAKVTTNTYNAFGELSSAAVGRNVYDANGSLLQAGVDVATTRYAYNQRGQQVAILDAENYLTRQQFDAYGNVISHVEFAAAYGSLAASWTGSDAGLPVADVSLIGGASDRGVHYEYDLINRKISETKLNVEFAQLSSVNRTDVNAHGSVKTQYGYDKLGNLVSTTEQEIDSGRASSGISNIGLITRTSYITYDMLGRVASTTSSGSGTSNTGVYTVYKRDAYGNAVVTSQTPMTQGSQSGNPLMTYMGSMDAGQNLLEGQALYSANGRFQLVMQSDGNLVMYDRQQGNASAPGLIWQSGTHAPSGNTGLAVQTDGNLVIYHAGAPLWQSSTSGSGMVLRLRDDGNLVLTNASQQIVWQTATIIAPSAASADVRESYAQYNAFGKVTDSVDAANNRSHQSYDANGNLVGQQRKVTDINGQVVGNSDSSAMVSMEYDATGKLVRTVELGVAGSSDTTETRYEYNAFGELQRQTVNGKTTLLNEYDNEGHLWRTTSGGITKVMLVDQEGRNTVQVTSAVDLNGFADASAVAARIQTDGQFTSSVTRYDHLGHVIERQLPNVGNSNKLEVTAQSSALSYKVIGTIDNNSTNVSNGRHDPNEPKGQTSDVSNSAFTGYNNVQITMPDMSTWGYGDVKVSIQFKTKLDPQGGSPTLGRIDKVYEAMQAKGVLEVFWNNDPAWALAAQDNITEIVISKKDATGHWITVNKLGPTQSNSNNAILQIVAPIDLNTTPKLRYRVKGDVNWSEGKLTNFGNFYIFNPQDGKYVADTGNAQGINRALAEGIYEYEVDYSQNNVGVSHSSGNMTVGYGDERIKIAQLYVALLNRAPTDTELNAAVDASHGKTLDQIAQAMLNRSDLVNLSVDAILDRIYTGALGRNIDAAGKTYWVAQWNSGTTNAHGSVVADIIRGTVAYTGDVAAIIESSKLFNNRVSVALTYGAELKGHDINVATQILLKVSATDTTVALAVGSVGNLVTDAQARLQMTRLYVLLLNRSPEFAGLDYYAGELKTKSRTINDEATVILSQSPLAGKSNDVIANTLFDTVLNWKDSAAKSDFLRELNKTTTLAQKATVILSLIDKVVDNTNVDFESRQAQQLFNNRVNVGMLYANSFSLKSVEDAATINALVTATDTLTAINAVFAKLDAAQNKQLNLTRLYVMLFNRAPDPKGYKYWLQQSNLDSNISFSTIANAIWTDKFATVNNIDLVKQIYVNTLGGDAASITESNQWVQELNAAGQPGAASKGEVLGRMINDLVNPSGSANFSSYARQVFTLKSATGMNFVALGGGDVTEATVALSAVESDLKSMSASLALQQAKANVAAASDKLAKAQQGADATKLAASMIAYEASAAALAYAKAQLQSTLTDFTKVDNDLTTAQNNLNTWVEQKKIVDKDLSLATALVQSADSAVAFANAAVQADNAIANQAALARAQQAKLEAEIQEGLAKVNQQGAAKALQDAQDNVQRLKDRRDALETAKKTAADNYAAAAADLTQKTNDRDAAQRTVDDNTITAANASAAFAKITAPLTSPNRLTIYQLYNIIFGESNPDLAGVQYWQATLDSGRMTVKQVIHAMYFDPSRRVNYLSPSSFFSRIYSSSLNLSSSDPGAIWWADTLQNAPDDNSIYPDPLGRPDKAEQIYTFYNGLLNEAYQGPYVGYANLQRVSTQSKDAGAVIIARAQSDFDNATAALALANKTLGERKGYMAEAENRLRSTPTDAQAISDFNDAKSSYDLAAGNLTPFQTAFDNAVIAVNAAHGWVDYFQNQVNGLQPAGGNSSPSGDVMNTLVGALSDYTVKKGLAEDAPKFAKKTSEALDAISQANPEHLKQVLQLYVLLFNRTDPDSAGVAYWVTRMKEGMQIVDIATSMYHDTNTYVNEGLDKKDPNVLMAGIYTNSLSRFDNDTAGVTYWANKLKAEPAQTQGAIFNALIFSVLNNENPDAQFLATRDKFIGKVNLAVSHAVSNASNALAVANAAVTKTASDASLALQRYLALKDAAGTAGANISIPTTTATATNLASILQVIMLLTNNQNIAPTFTVKMGGWIDGIATGKETVDSIAGKIYTELNLNSVGSYSLIQSIYYGALGRTAPDPLNGESYWASRLDTARQSGEAAIGNVFNSLISGLANETSVISVAFASRRLFDQKVATFISNFQSVQQAFINSVLIPAKYGDGQVLIEAQRTFEQAKIASDTAHQNASAVYGVSTAPTISATEAQKSVARLYALMFNRAPETSGLSYWSASVGSTNLSSIAQLMLDGAKPGDLPAGLSNAGFVNLMYSNLGSTDSKNIATHINDLSTKTRGQVAYEILSETMSNGTADQASADRLRLLANKTAVGLTYALTMNGDSVGVARTLFANVTADNATAGINAALNTKPAVYARTQVASLFIMMFGREADLDGFDHWAERVPAIDAPLADRVMFVQNMISGDAAQTLEAYSLNDTDFINKIYTNAFGQQPDAAGRNYWLQQLGSKSRAEVILGIMYDTQNSPASASADATTQLQFRLNQKTFNEKLSSALNHLAVLEQTKLTNAGQVDQGNLDQLKTAASVAAGLAIAADLAALQAMGDIGRISQIPKAADISWIPTLNINNGSNSTPVAPAGYNSIIQTNDRWGNVLSATDVRDPKLLTRYHYDSDNRLIETTRVDGVKITDAYNSLGQKIGAMDANGNISFNVLDASGHVLEEHRADGHVARQDFNAFGDRTTYTDATGYQTTFKYDAMGRVSSQTQVGAVNVYHSTDLTANGGEEYETTKQLTISYKYDELDRRIQTTDAAGGILRTWYDLRGNVIKADNESHTIGSNGTQTTSRFDALNHKVNETDAINGQKNWVYDIATGRLASKTDLGGHTTQYDYNYYNQVVGEHGDGVIYKKDIKTTYNQLGQVLTIQDAGTSTYTYYQYDVAGNRLSENVTQVNNTHVSVLQDNHLSYDKLGRLAVVQTDRYSLTYAYDNNGNRTMVSSYYVTDTAASTNANGELVNTVGGNQIKSKEQIKTTWNTYDAMNRQVIVDGVKAEGIIGISAEQGHQFTYDNEGRRLSDTSYGKKITSTSANVLGIPVTMTGTTAGNVTETYTYDAIGRLNTISRDGVEIDKRYYNANSQLVRSGVSNDLINQIRGNGDLKKSFQDAGVSAEFTIYQYKTDKIDQVDIQQVHTAIAGAELSGTRFIYDSAGRLTLYTKDTETVVGYHYDAEAQFDQYQASAVVGNRGGGEAKTLNKYDVNGHLTSVTDSTDTSNKRSLFVDTAGNILRKEQKNDNTYSLLVNGELIGTSSKDYVSDTINQSYVKQSALSGNGPSIYVSQQGDTLQSIAKTVWGDATLWYLIADANGLATTEPQSGTKLLIPAREVSGGNRTDTFKPYNPGEIIGDTTPNMPMPQGQDGGCGPVGIIVTIAVAIILTVLTKGATSPYLKAAIAAASSTAGQYAAVAAGEQKEVNWKGVALSAVSAGIASGFNFPIVSNDIYVQAAVKGMAQNVITQGVAIALNLQRDFNWKSVAGAGAGGAAGTYVGGELKGAFAGLGEQGQMIAQQTLTGFATGMTATLVRGGRMYAGQVLVDAFGNALGESLATGNVSSKENTSESDNDNIFRRRGPFDSLLNPSSYTSKLGFPRFQGWGSINNESYALDGNSLSTYLTRDSNQMSESGLDAAMNGSLAVSGGSFTEQLERARRLWTPSVHVVGSRMTEDEKLGYDIVEHLKKQSRQAKAAEEDVSYVERAARGVFGALDSVTRQPILQVRDLVYGGFAVGYNELFRSKNAPVFLPEMTSNIARAYSKGASRSDIFFQSNPVTGVASMVMDSGIALHERRYGDVFETAGGLLGGFAIGAGVNRYGNYNVSFKPNFATTNGAVLPIPFRLIPPEELASFADGPYSLLSERPQRTTVAPIFGNVMGPNDGPQLPQWRGSVDYSGLTDSPKVGPGKDFTRAQKVNIYEQNQLNNDGLLRSDLDGRLLVLPSKSMSGVTPKFYEAQVDHITPRNPLNPENVKGTNSYSNAQVLSREQNRAKSNN